jgi:hypothetical protein
MNKISIGYKDLVGEIRYGTQLMAEDNGPQLVLGVEQRASCLRVGKGINTRVYFCITLFGYLSRSKRVIPGK